MDVVIAPMELTFAEHGAELPPGEFKGYGAVFGNTDSHGDVIATGAFADTLAERAAEGRRHVPLHVTHCVLGGDATETAPLETATDAGGTATGTGGTSDPGTPADAGAGLGHQEQRPGDPAGAGRRGLIRCASSS